MKKIDGIDLSNVQDVYSGPEGDLWELIMGEQIHIGGLISSMELAEKANVAPGTKGVDFCCCNGAGMRFLIRFRNVDHMQGIDATETVIERGRRYSSEQKLSHKTNFILADVCDSGLDDNSADF
ncbi:MAG: class I SAM-dependent methyltransferase, partial [Planctomycetota bacterium]